MRFVVDPVYWSTRMIISQDEDVICELAKKAAATSTAYRLVAGRCLLAIEETKLYRKLGLSGAVHYGVRVLKLTRKAAQTLLRVARALEGLPRLSQAAEGGKIAWSSLREIVSKATLETEEVWLRLALEKDADEVARLASLTERGRLPWEQPEADLPTTRMRLNLRPETGELFERAVQSLSRRGGKAVTASEALDHLLQEFFAKRPLDARASRALAKDLSRGREAARRRQARLIQEAQRIAAGIPSDGADCPLSVALGLPSREAELEPGDEELMGMELEALSSLLDEQGAPGEGGPARDGQGVPGEGPSRDERGVSDVGPGRDKRGVLNDGPSRDEQGASDEGRPSRDELGVSDDGPGRDEQGVPVPTGNRGGVETGGAALEAALSESIADFVGADAAGVFAYDRNAEIALAGNPKDWRNPRVKFNPKARRATPAQRLELLRRDGHRCRTPGCPHHLWLDMHHLLEYCKGGATSPEQLVGLCWRCHWNVHHGFMTIEGNAETGLVFRDAEGEDIGRHHSLEVAGWLDLHIGWSGQSWESHTWKLMGAGLCPQEDGVLRPTRKVTWINPEAAKPHQVLPTPLENHSDCGLPL